MRLVGYVCPAIKRKAQNPWNVFLSHVIYCKLSNYLNLLPYLNASPLDENQ